jgi:hypothetical protein
MNRREFKTWFSEFRAAFASVDSWITKLPAAASDAYDGATQESLSRAWFLVLEDVPLADAKRATAEMARGDIRSPLAFQDYPREIRAAVKSSGTVKRPPGPRQTADGEDTFECRDCRDWGHVRVFTPEAVAAMRAGEYQRTRPPIPRYPAIAVRCHCKWGDFYRSYGAPFDSSKQVSFSGAMPGEDDVKLLAAFVERTPVAVPYDEWNR